MKWKLLNLREGEVLEVSTKDLANYHNGGAINIPNGAPQQHTPLYRMDPKGRSAAIVRAYKELRLFLLHPPPGIIAEELPGAQFRVRFVRIEQPTRRSQ
ncbi:MAG: hypothetical protein QXU73_07610 [Thermoplasmata archaeon]